MQGGNNKMTLADIRQIYFVMLSTREYRHKMRQYRNEVKDIRRQLMRNTQMASVGRTLDQIIDSMDTEERVLEVMHTYLECSLYAYERYEERITEYAEEKAQTGTNKLKIDKFKIPEEIFRLLF